MNSPRDHAKILLDLIETVHRLRAPGGCPWDREQTHQSLRPYLIEEAYEALDVLDEVTDDSKVNDPKISKNLTEELGDVWMQVLLHSEMASERGAFDIYTVAASLNDKLIRRHPHVFGSTEAKSSDEAYRSWEKQKALEKKKANQEGAPAPSVLDGIPKGLPALQKTARVIEKATKVGFQWSDLQGPLQKVGEELEELRAELAAPEDKRDSQKVSNELGDLFFALCNLSFMLKINPEDALRSTLDRFRQRFTYVEKKLAEKGKLPEQSTLEEMDAYWNEAKRHLSK